jgi:hypothetical protein
MCTKKAPLHVIVDKKDFTLLQGEDALSEYNFGSGVARHLFCKHCGIHSFYVPRSHPDGFSVNLRCLDDFPKRKEEFVLRGFEGAEWEANIHKIR